MASYLLLTVLSVIALVHAGGPGVSNDVSCGGNGDSR